tara:strand:+ start:1326 stop:1988 length:663 start_codon:yes stop_codon:yes gene_type:complete
MNPETDFSIRSFLGGYDKNLTYLITCNRTGTQAIVDAAIDTSEITQFLRNDPVAILITHGHADHIASLDNYVKKYPETTILGHPDSKLKEGYTNFKEVGDNQEFIIGEMRFKCIHTPGHYFDSICYQISPVLFTGDTMFVGRTGRIKGKNSSIEDLYDSIYNKILKLPRSIKIYPGHDYGDRPNITLEENILNSPLLGAKSLDDFKKRMDDYEKNRKIGS